jgi:hypothetical protein
MARLFLKAYILLLYFDLQLLRGGFAGLCQKVHVCPVRLSSRATNAVARVSRAMDLACIWYFKDVLCLQRSAATACLLKRQGVTAELVIGSQQLPFRAHAWVDASGSVVNDKPYVGEMYTVLERF